MSKIIGMVTEGPTDYLVLKAIIDKITGKDNQYRQIQPETDMIGRYGNGWKGVWKWCNDNPSIDILMDGIQPQIDIIVIQMDGDVVRKEKEAHCQCPSTACNMKGTVFPIYCDKVVHKDCPVVLPCQSHIRDINGIIQHGKALLNASIHVSSQDRIIITIPCDSIESWVVAAYDGDDNAEKIEDPWKNIISVKKMYHGVRVRRDQKCTQAYDMFAKEIAEKWDIVTAKCQSAKLLESEIKEKLI